MAYRELEVTLLSARDLKSVNLITRMDVYAVATISGDPLTRQCTAPDRYGGRHPSWNATLRFAVPPTAAATGLCLHVLLRAERILGDHDVGEVIIPLADLLAGADATPAPRLASYHVHKVHRPGEPLGVLNLSYRLGPVVAPVEAAPVVVAGYPVTTGPPDAYDPHAAEGAVKAPRPARNGGEAPPPPTQIFFGLDAYTQINLGERHTSPRTSLPKGFSQQDDRQVVGARNVPAAYEKTDHRLGGSKPAIPQQNTTRAGGAAYGHTPSQSNNNNHNPGKIDTSGSFPQQQDRQAYHAPSESGYVGKIDSSGHKAFPRHDTQVGAYAPPPSRSNIIQRMPDRQGPNKEFIQQDKHVRAYAH